MNDPQATVCVLVSTKVEENSFRKYLNSSEECYNNVEFFSDPDHCIDSLILTQHAKYLLILGSGQCHLVDILSSFSCILYIYLTEAHGFKDASHVQGIYVNPEQLLCKLKKDLKMIADNDASFSISSSIEANMSGATTTDIQHDRVAFSWIRVILCAVLNTPKPAENIYEDMLKECRIMYQDNQSMCQKVDDFETTYNPENAIRWYTKDSFLYRQINAAFRTENIVNIWKFRFIIQDIYKQLELMHAEQIKSSNSAMNKVYHLYRGQHMTSDELKRIKDNVDHLIVINSFLSTTLNYSLAVALAGNGEHRPKRESVIFEIIIDECKLQHVPIIFANIASESNFEEEQETLLAMGTILHIESVELEENIWKICLQVYPLDDGLCRNVERMYPGIQSYLASSDTFARVMIASTLLETGSFEKAEQICQLTNPFEDPSANIMLTFLKGWINLFKLARTSPRLIQSTDIKEQLNQIKESLQQIKQLLNLEDCGLLNAFEMHIKEGELLIEQRPSLDFNTSDMLKYFGSMFSLAIRQRLLPVSSSTMVQNDSSIRYSTDLIDAIGSNNVTFESMNFEEIQLVLDQCLTKNDPRRIELLQLMALNAKEKNKYDEAIEYLQSTLLIPCNDDQHAKIYSQLAQIYKEQKNWTAALECYENIITMSQLSDISSTLPNAHINAASMYNKMQDIHNAIVYYKRGVQLYCQHYSPHHPIVSSTKIIIGLKFQELEDMDAALKTFQEVIELDHSDEVKVAYEQIGRIYRLRNDHDMAYFYFDQSLAISRREVVPDIDFMIDIHQELVFVECLRNHFDEAQIHLNEAIHMSTNYTCDETTRQNVQSTIKLFSALQCFAPVHNHN